MYLVTPPNITAPNTVPEQHISHLPTIFCARGLISPLTCVAVCLIGASLCDGSYETNN